MSRVGKIPVDIPKGVDVVFKADVIQVKGPKGQLSQWIDPSIELKIEDNKIAFNPTNETKKVRAFHGLYRNLVRNMVEGVTSGFSKSLELIGVGFDAEMRGHGLYLELGLSHAVYLFPPKGVVIEVIKPKGKIEAPGTMNQYLISTIKVTGADKCHVGEVAAKIRTFKKPDSYKSKGIRYVGERVHLKAGKSGVGA